MPYKIIKAEPAFDGQVMEIILGPPPGNIVSQAMVAEISAELERLNTPCPDTRPIKLVVFRGAGKHFSYGASVEEHQPDQVGNMLPAFHQMISQVIKSDIPTLARVSGVCLGGGFELALACALIFCDDTAKFGLPEIKLGVFPPPASILLPLKIGEVNAAQMVLSGQNCPAQEALKLGLVNGVSTPDGLDETVSRFIEQSILPKSAVALRKACRAVRLPMATLYQTHIAQVEALYLDDLMKSSDAMEGITAFLEKRPPKWVDA